MIAETPSQRRKAATATACALTCLLVLVAVLAFSSRSAAASGAHEAAVHYACSSANSAHVPCRFSTPSGNIRCLWTPHPNTIVCELLATGRAYRLRPTGRARTVVVHLARRGETLPRSQQIVFPESLSCNDTRTTMKCNQDEGFGEFELAPKGSHDA